MINDSRFKNKLHLFFVTLFGLFVISYSLLVRTAQAVCPICTVAVAAGRGLSRWLGIDDAVTSIWIGGLVLSSSFWLIDFLRKKKPEFSISKFQFPIIFLMYAIVILPLWSAGIIGHPFNTILGIDKILFGTTVGSVFFLLGIWADKKVRAIKGKQLFPFQKVVFPVVLLAIISLLLYFYGGYLY